LNSFCPYLEMGCLNCVQEKFKPVSVVTVAINQKPSVRLARASSKSDIGKYLLSFPKIKKSYQHLITAWCAAIRKPRPNDAKAIFKLSGPRDKVREVFGEHEVSRNTIREP